MVIIIVNFARIYAITKRNYFVLVANTNKAFIKAIAFPASHPCCGQSAHGRESPNFSNNKFCPRAFVIMFIAIPTHCLRKFAFRKRIVYPVNAIIIEAHFIPAVGIFKCLSEGEVIRQTFETNANVIKWIPSSKLD